MTSTLLTKPSSTAREAALHYAGLGCPVIPLYGASYGLCSCGKAGCPSPGKHPRTANGVKDSTLELDLIETWWEKWSDANVGVALGQHAGMFALDVDPDKGGVKSLEALQKRFGPLPPTLRQTTGGGGFHLFFRNPLGVAISNSVGDLGAGLDIRAERGYCVVPPSNHISGRAYAWDESVNVITEAPAWLLDRLVKKPQITGLQFSDSPTSTILEGARNSTLASCAGAMRHHGMSPSAIEEALLVDNRERCMPPLDDQEVVGIAQSISKYEPARQAPAPLDVPLDGKAPCVCSVELVKAAPVQTNWLVDEFIPSGSVVLLAAREGHMKTWLALEMAHGVGEGVDWIGRECLPGKALLIDGENPDDMLKQRLAAVGESPNVYVWRWQEERFPSSLDDPWLKRAAKDFDLLIIDTLKRFMSDLDENSSTEMARITGQLRELTRYGASVLVLHHAKKDGEKPGYRGSSELGAGVDVVYLVEKGTNNGEEYLKITSVKDRFKPTGAFMLRIENSEGGPVFKPMEGGASECLNLTFETATTLSAIISDLTLELERAPNQSEIVRTAATKGFNRRAVRRNLSLGNGRYWNEVASGKSKVYQALPTGSLIPLQGERTEQNNEKNPSNNQFTSSGGIGMDNGTNRQDELGKSPIQSATRHEPQVIEVLGQQVTQ